LTDQRTGILQRSFRLARDGARDQVSKGRLATVPLSAARRLPSHRGVYSRREALADPQGSLNSVPLGPLPAEREFEHLAHRSFVSQPANSGRPEIESLLARERGWVR
jgi:hypothetical protein